MTLLFLIVVGTVLAALLLLRARLREEQGWEEFFSRDGPPEALQSEDHQDTDEHPNSQIGEMNAPAPMLTTRSPHDADLRRSSRVERPIPLLILGTNRRGEAFREKTSAVSVNLHGCRYSSCHDYAPEGWIALQITGTEGANSSVVRARVRSIHSPQTPRELCQVGIELETPGNVWGIPAPPEDWERLLGTRNSAAHAAGAVATVPDSSTPLSSFLGKRSAPPERIAEVAVFPGPSANATPATEVAPSKEPAPSKDARPVITVEQLLHTLQGKIQLAVDKAVQSSLSTQLEEAVKVALAKIENGRRANVRQAEELAEEFRRRVEVQIDLILAEAKERATSSFAFLDAESHAAIGARRRTLETDMARAAEESIMEFRSGVEVLLHSCLLAAVSAVGHQKD